MRPIDLVLSRLDNPKPNGRDRWRSRCPSCGGKNRSKLSIGIGENDSVLLECFAGCDVEQIANAIGLELVDLFPSCTPRQGSGPLNRRRLLSAQQAMEVVEFETILVSTAAFNLANGHTLTVDDLSRLAVAAERIVALAREVRQ